MELREWTTPKIERLRGRFTDAEVAERYRARHPGRHLETQRNYHARNAEKHQNARRDWRYANPVKRLLQTAKARAKQRGLEFSITEADLLPLPTHCPILGIELQYGGLQGKNLRGRDKWGLASLDRRNNSEGYIPGNVFIVSLRANMLKSDGSASEHERIAMWMAGHQE
jgi:hypothetical protein